MKSQVNIDYRLDSQQNRPSLPPRVGRQPSISSNNSNTGEPNVKPPAPPKPVKPSSSRNSSIHSISETPTPTPRVSGTLLPPPSLANLAK